MRNEPAPQVGRLGPWSAEPAYFARPVGTGTRVSGVVVLRASVTAAAADVAARWGTIGAGALLVAVVFVLLAVVLARWMVRPLHELETGVLAVAAGHRAHVPERAGPRELRVLAGEVNRMSEAVLEAAEQQHRLVADASHQLRNPHGRAAPARRFARRPGRRRRGHLPGDRRRGRTPGEAPRRDAGPGAGREHGDAGRRRGRGRVVRPRGRARRARRRLASGRRRRRCDARPAAGARRAGHRALPGRRTRADPRCAAGQRRPLRRPRREDHHRLGKPAPTPRHSSSRDDGPGLSTEDRARATERFWRAGGEGAPRGTGLGLAIAHQQVRTRGGVLELRQARRAASKSASRCRWRRRDDAHPPDRPARRPRPRAGRLLDVRLRRPRTDAHHRGRRARRVSTSPSPSCSPPS